MGKLIAGITSRASRSAAITLHRAKRVVTQNATAATISQLGFEDFRFAAFASGVRRPTARAQATALFDHRNNNMRLDRLSPLMLKR